MGKDALNVVVLDGTVARATAPFKTRTNAPIRSLKLSNGAVVEGTDNHLHKRVPVVARRDGGKRPGKLKNAEWVELRGFSVGDYIGFQLVDVHKNAELDQSEYQKGAVCGWVVGDGWLRKSECVSLCFGPHERDTQARMESWLGIKATPHAQKPETCSVLNLNQSDSVLYRNLIGDNKFDVEWVRLQSQSFKVGWLSALFTADGAIRRHKGKGGCELYSAHRKLLLFVQSLLAEFGVYSSVLLHNNARTYVAIDGKVRNNTNSIS